MNKNFTKNMFTTIMKAFYDEIKEKRGSMGNPNVVIYRYSGTDVKFNPRKELRVDKKSITVNNMEIPYTDIRGVNFYFDKEQ